MYDANDIVELKNKKKRRKRLVRFTVFLLIAGALTALYFTRETWYPKLKGISDHYQTIVNDGELASGNFPIEVSGENSYQLGYSKDTVAVLSDAYIYFYNTEGALIKRRQHALTNPIMETDNGRFLIFESGGNEFAVEDINGVVYSGSFDSANILFARLSKEGNTAVVITSENYDCEIQIFDKKGNVIYQRKCIERVNDISFKEDSSECVVSYVYAENGAMVTSVQEINTHESGENWTSPGIDTLGLDVFGFDNGAFVLGIDACGYVDGKGQISSYYKYDGDLAGGSSSGGNSAVIINNYDRRMYQAVLFKDGNSEPTVINMGEPLIDVTVENDLAYIMCSGKILAYDFSGSLRSTARINDSYTGFVRSEEYIFLKGFNKIDRIDYNS